MDRARVVLAIAVLLAVPAVPGLSGGTAQARVQYDAILEWTGPYFRVKNAPLVDQLTDTPAHDMTFVQPYAVAAREHAAGQRDVVYVVDSGHNRVQLFEVNAQYVSADQSAFTWRQGGATAASEWDSDQIHLAEWAASAEHWVVPYSEVVTINGGAWTRVADLTGFTAADRVYTLDYSDASDAPVLNFPANSLAQTSTIVLRYVTSDNQTGAADAFGLGDVDYGVGAGGTPVLAKIDQTSGGPASWQQLRSIALIADEVTATTDDVFLVDAADNSGAQNQELFEFTVTSAGTVAYVGAYDDVLTTPNDVAVARSGASTAAAAALTGGPGPFTAATVTDAAQVTGHVYDVTVAAGSVTITAETTLIRSPPVSATKRYRFGTARVVSTFMLTPTTPALVSETPGIPRNGSASFAKSVELTRTLAVVSSVIVTLPAATVTS